MDMSLTSNAAPTWAPILTEYERFLHSERNSPDQPYQHI